MNGLLKRLLIAPGVVLALASSSSQALGGPTFSISNPDLDDSIRGCDHDGILDSGERGRLRLTVTNSSEVDASNVTIEATDADLLPGTLTVHVDTLTAGASVTPSFEVELADGVQSRLSEFAIAVRVGAEVVGTRTWSTLVQSDVLPDIVSDRHECVNLPPEVDAGEAQSVVAGALVTLHGVASDPDGDTLTYQWRQRAGSSADLDDGTTLSPHFTAPGELAANRLVFELKATDSFGHETIDTVTIDVSAVEIPSKPPAKQPTEEPAQHKTGCHTIELSAMALIGLLARRLKRQR